MLLEKPFVAEVTDRRRVLDEENPFEAKLLASKYSLT